MTLNSYLFKASWRSTSHSFWVTAPNELKAQMLAEKYVSKMEGGSSIIDLTLLKIDGGHRPTTNS